jgi:hypothetical protein
LLHVNGEGQEYMGLVVLSMLVATLILGSWISVKFKGPWGQECV